MKKCAMGLLLALLLLLLPFPAKAEAPSTMEQATVRLRQILEERVREATLEFTSEAPLEDPATTLFWEAVAHTGVPTQGDYIYRHMDSMDYEEDVRQEDGLWHYRLRYTFAYHSTYQEEQLLSQAVTSLLQQLELADKSDYRKALTIYDYICQNVAYDSEEQTRSAYGALLEGKAVCQGYASLFYRLALEAGLDCRIVSGYAGGVHHGWNIVKIRASYYNLDTTWDAGSSRYIYFLKGTRNFYLHSPDDAYRTPEFAAAYPMTEANYHIVSDCTGEHSFTQFKFRQDATCTRDGTQMATCDNCEVTQILPAPGTVLGHTFGDYTPNSDATMYKDGTKTAQCIRCDQTDTLPNPGSRLPKNSWLLEAGIWYYYREDAPVTGWLKYAKDWYYLGTGGKMATGWLKYGKNWYYLRSSGAMATGWIQLQGTWYYLDASGAMATGWIQLQGTWYYLNQSGAMATGWLKYGKDWYYLRSSGAMATGWVQLQGIWYYLDASGAMVTGSRNIGGKTYRFNENGACLNP